MAVALPFPEVQPAGYEWFDDEPTFDPAIHLQLETPSNSIALVDLGYDEAEIANKATPFAVSSPFRVLSDEGANALLHACRRLKTFHRSGADRIERITRGGCYRSRFLRDLCVSPDLTDHMSSIYGIEVAPHPMGLHLGHLNFEPTKTGTNVDKWHHDTLPLDFVMMVTDPATLHGGHFEWFHGTKHEVAVLAAKGQTPPRDRVIAPAFPTAGFTIALHGDMVVHRAAALTRAGERITMVNGYVSVDSATDNQSRTTDLINVDDHEVLFTEWAKFAAWRSAGRLQSVIDSLPFGTGAQAAAAALDEAITDAQLAAAEMRTGFQGQIHHYE